MPKCRVSVALDAKLLESSLCCQSGGNPTESLPLCRVDSGGFFLGTGYRSLNQAYTKGHCDGRVGEFTLPKFSQVFLPSLVSHIADGLHSPTDSYRLPTF